jgi:hypothetical protein
MVIHELTGINAIMLYSNKILAAGGSSSSISPRTGTQIIGAVNLFSSATAIWSAKTFSRRTLLIWGHLLMGLCHLCVGLTFEISKPTYCLVALCLFIFFFENSSGCITWLYCSEVSVDVALGLVGMSGYCITFILSLVTEPLMLSPLHESGTFYMFGGISLVAAVWFFFFLKETSTVKTDKEKKELYVPEDLKDVPLIDSD